MIAREVICEYEKLLLKKKTNYSNLLLTKNSLADSAKNATIIFKYAFEELLGWNANDVCHMLTNDILRDLKLEIPLKYLPIPGDIDQETRNRIIASFLYPNQISFSNKEMTISVYKKVISKKLYGFPKRFLNEEKGRQRARICLNYVIKTFLQFHSIEEMYLFFSKPEGIRALKKYQLLAATYDLFDTPIDFLHESLPEHQQDEFLFHYYKFKILYNRKKKELID